MTYSTRYFKVLLSVSLLMVIFASHAQPEAYSKLGISTGYSHYLLRDEQQFVRNFYGGGIPLKVSLTKIRKNSMMWMEVSYQKNRLSASRSATTALVHSGRFHLAYQKRIGMIEQATASAGVMLRNQLTARTYSFNSPFTGQDPFTGDFFSSPALLFSFQKALGQQNKLSWQLSYSPLAYLFSRGYHPIRGYPNLGDVPRGLVLLPDFHDFQSNISVEREIKAKTTVFLTYSWQYWQYRREYLFQAANQQLEAGVNIMLGK